VAGPGPGVSGAAHGGRRDGGDFRFLVRAGPGRNPTGSPSQSTSEQISGGRASRLSLLSLSLFSEIFLPLLSDSVVVGAGRVPTTRMLRAGRAGAMGRVGGTLSECPAQGGTAGRRAQCRRCRSAAPPPRMDDAMVNEGHRSRKRVVSLEVVRQTASILSFTQIHMRAIIKT
jgi:hypothetical protein